MGKHDKNYPPSLKTARIEKPPLSTRDAPLYNHKSMTSSSKIELIESTLMLKEFETNPNSNDPIGNTPLTDFLGQRVFNTLSDYTSLHQQEIKAVLTQLCALAKTSKSALSLLTSPNNPNLEINADLIQNGLPLNTPLMLMVKAGDLEAVKLLLPFYSAADLMITTPRGNSVFHIASITGQEEVLVALKNRAQELNIWNVYKEHKNREGHTAFQMLTALYSTRQFFNNLLDFSAFFLGGEEINKAAVSNQGQCQVYMARKGAVKFYKSLAKDQSVPRQDFEDTVNQEQTQTQNRL